MHLEYENALPMIVMGHCTIEDDLGNVLLDKDNAVHPQNLSRIFARAMSNESNFHVHRIAFGNGGTDIDAAFTVTFRSPNDGQPPDTQTWDSRLYNETYSEIIDDSVAANLLGTDPGSSDSRVGARPGGGAVPEDDVASNLVESRAVGLTAEVKVELSLNPSEPTGQLIDDQTSGISLDGSFTFDEIGLFTAGAPARDSTGTQDVDVGNKTSTDRTSLAVGVLYDFDIKVDGASSFATIQVTSNTINNPTYGELIEALRDPAGAAPDWTISQALPADAIVSITDTTFGTYPTISGNQTFGFLRFISNTSGDGSSIELQAGTTNDMFVALPGTILPAEDGVDKGVVDATSDPDTEQERLLTHLIFAPVLKAANRTLRITYTLTIAVARTAST